MTPKKLSKMVSDVVSAQAEKIGEVVAKGTSVVVVVPVVVVVSGQVRFEREWNWESEEEVEG